MIPVTEMKIDDFAWGMFGNDLRRKVEARAFDMRRVVLERKGDPSHPTDQGGKTEQGMLIADPTDVPACIAEASGYADGLIASKKWDTPLCDTEVRVEASIWMGRVWIPLAILPAGTSDQWQAVQLMWPETPRVGFFGRITGLVRSVRLFLARLVLPAPAD